MPARAIPQPVTFNEDIKALLYKEVPTTGWKEDAACWMSMNTCFFELSQEAIDASVEICNTCRVRQSCLKVAMGMGDKPAMIDDGVFGGYFPAQRKMLRRRLFTTEKVEARKEA